jgi:serine/threonine protein kinase
LVGDAPEGSLLDRDFHKTTMPTIEGRYALEREIGRGATGSVWTAYDGQLGRRVAIKLLRVDCLEYPAARSRFEHEAWTIAQFRSPHIVQVHDSGAQDGQPFIVMELLEGESLEARLHRHPRLPLPIVAGIVVEVAKALALSHQAGIIHRDLKPANIFLAREHGREVVKLLDFGIATLVAGNGVDGPESSTRTPTSGRWPCSPTRC